jgi:hypothetical protein
VREKNVIFNLKEELTDFLNQSNDNPFLLYPFLESALSEIPKNSSPLFLISRINGRIVGLAPLVVRREFGASVASFLIRYEFSPDFIIEEGYEDNFFNDFLRKLSKLKFILDLEIPIESKTLSYLEKACLENKISFKRSASDTTKHHSVIQVDDSWDLFEKNRGKHFRQKFRTIERDIKRRGNYRILTAKPLNEEPEKIFDEILKIEKNSWKDAWRTDNNVMVDKDLFWIWRSALSAGSVPAFNLSVYFLEFENDIIAYALIVQYKGYAAITKSTYIRAYENLHVGLFTVHSAIKDLFNYPAVREIDFMTNLFSSKFWATDCYQRVTCTVNNGSIHAFLCQISKSVKSLVIVTRNRIKSKHK